MPSQVDYKLGDLAVKRGYAKLNEVNDCLMAIEEAEELGETDTISALLVKREILDEEQLAALKKELDVVEAEATKNVKTRAVPTARRAKSGPVSAALEPLDMDNSETVPVEPVALEELKKVVAEKRELEQAPTVSLDEASQSTATGNDTRATTRRTSPVSRTERRRAAGASGTSAVRSRSRGTSRARAKSRSRSVSRATGRQKKRNRNMVVLSLVSLAVLGAAIMGTVAFLKKHQSAQSRKEQPRPRSRRKYTVKAQEKRGLTRREKVVQAAEAKIKELEAAGTSPRKELIAAYQHLAAVLGKSPRANEIRAKVQALKKQAEEAETSKAMAEFEDLRQKAEELFARNKFKEAFETLDSLSDDSRIFEVMQEWNAIRSKYKRQVMRIYQEARLAIIEIGAAQEAATNPDGANGPAGGSDLPDMKKLLEYRDLLAAVAGIGDDAMQEEARQLLEQMGRYISIAETLHEDKRQRQAAALEAKSRALYANFLPKYRQYAKALQFEKALQLAESHLRNPQCKPHRALYQTHLANARLCAQTLEEAAKHLPNLIGQRFKVDGRGGVLKGVEGQTLLMQIGPGQVRADLRKMELSRLLSVSLGGARAGSPEYQHRLAVFIYNRGETVKADETLKAALKAGLESQDARNFRQLMAREVARIKMERRVAELVASAKKSLKRKHWKEAHKALQALYEGYMNSDTYAQNRAFIERNFERVERRMEQIDGLVDIPAGSYLDELGDPHKVNGFQIDRYEVTNAQYRRFLDWIQKTGDHSKCHPSEPKKKDHTPAYWSEPYYNRDDFPVTGVDWFDAYAYANWSGRRLLTSMEWERAYRGDTGWKYPWGDKWEPEKLNANDGNEQDGGIDGWEAMAPEWTFAQGKSPFGIFHLAGNVREWIGDVRIPRSANSIMRAQTAGGSFIGSRSQCQATARGRMNALQRAIHIGFRTAK